jgi:PilZ domain
MRSVPYLVEKVSPSDKKGVSRSERANTDRSSQRSDMRYPVKARVDFWWQGEDRAFNGNGTSRDVSEKGAFVVAPTIPPLGTDVGLTFFLPKLSKAIAAVRIEVEAKVIRVDQETEAEKRGGFAVLTKAAILRKNGKSGGRSSARSEAKNQNRA